MQLGSTELAFVSVLIVLGLIVPLVLAVSRRKGARVLAVALIFVGCLADCFVAAVGFWRGSGFLLTSSGATPFPFSLGIDGLSAFFLLLICTVAAPVTIFAFTYF